MEQKKCTKCGRSLMIDKDTPLPSFSVKIGTEKLGRKGQALMQRLTHPYKINTDYPVCSKCLLDAFLKK